jgi:tetratricopeptide (TPR) repeat protein
MSHSIRTFVLLAIAIALLAPLAVAQKAPAPPPPPPSAPSGRSPTPISPNSDVTQPRDDLVMFLRGRVATDDGTPVPHDVFVERVCNNRARQEVYASARGDFSMQLGSRTDSFPEASADSTSQSETPNRDPNMGISRRLLVNCDLRASAAGFRPGTVGLMDLDSFGGSADVGVIVVHRAVKVKGTTLDATPYKAPKDARKAYEKGLDAEKKDKLADAQKYFESAVQLYPKSANTWFQLGTVLQKQNQEEAARKAFTQATEVDAKFLPPYLSLASMATRAENWTEVRDLTGHILDLDPLNRVSGYILDLDPLNYGDAYFYNALANYKLNRFADAERSGLKAEHLDLRTRFPQLHLLMAELFARKNDYALAIGEVQTYLALVPHAPDEFQAREQLAKFEKLNASLSTAEKPDQK